ncbi:hypothetical protein EGW08_023165, partial [Elysia chlorotica]
VCVCKPGWRYPFFIERPFQGENVEVATESEYYNGFECTPTDYRIVLPVVDQLSGVTIEGGGVKVNSGGLPLDLVEDLTGRRRRDTRAVNGSAPPVPNRSEERASIRSESLHVNVANRNGSAVVYNKHGGRQEGGATDVFVMKVTANSETVREQAREPTPHEMIALAERLRELGENQKLQEYLDIQGLGYKLGKAREGPGDDYAQMNNVDISVEKEYE